MNAIASGDGNGGLPDHRSDRTYCTDRYRRGVEARNRLSKLYGKGRWRKLKGFASVRLPDGTIHRAEVHWYEAHGIGRKELKLKLPLLN